MIGYKYNGFVIKRKFDSFKCTAWHVFKDGVLFSVMAFSKPAIAKKVIDLSYKGTDLILQPFNYYV